MENEDLQVRGLGSGINTHKNRLFFDAYACTIYENHDQIMQKLQLQFWGNFWYRTTGSTNGYQELWVLKKNPDAKHSIVRAYMGGNCGGIHLDCKGYETTKFVECIRRNYPDHKVTRADVSVDFEYPGAWEGISTLVKGYKDSHGITRRTFDGEENGVTVYLGSNKSPVSLRCYQKGKEQHGPDASPDWVRVELCVRPSNKEAKDAASKWHQEQFFGASSWSANLLQVLLSIPVERFKIGTVWRSADTQRARLALLRQYKTIIADWVVDLGGWEEFGSVVIESIEEAEAKRQEYA